MKNVPSDDKAAQRRLAARVAAYAKWARQDPVAGTAAGRAAFNQKFFKEVDPDNTLDETERRRRAMCARREYFARLALRGLEARRAARERKRLL